MSNSPAAGRPSPVNAGGVATATRCSLDGCGRARQHGVVAARSCARCVVAPVALGVHQVALRPVECALGAGGVIEEEADVATLARRRLLAAPRPTHRALSQARKERGRSESEKSVRAEETERASMSRVHCMGTSKGGPLPLLIASSLLPGLSPLRMPATTAASALRGCVPHRRSILCRLGLRRCRDALSRARRRSRSSGSSCRIRRLGAHDEKRNREVARGVLARAAHAHPAQQAPAKICATSAHASPRARCCRLGSRAGLGGALKDTTAASAEHRHVSIALRGRLHQQRPHQRRAGAANHLRLDVLDLMRGRSVSIIIGTKHHRSARGLRTRQHGREVARACVAGWQRLTPRAAPSSAATLSSVVANAAAASASCRSRASCSRGVSSGTSRSPAGATASANGGGVAMLTAER